MRLTRKAVFAGLASLAMAGTALAAGPSRHHVVNLALPDGSIAQVHYVGDTPPQLVVAPVAAPVLFDGFDLFDASAGADLAPFAMLDRIAADMDRQFAQLHQAAFAAGGAGIDPASIDLAAAAQLPAGATSYSFVSTSNGNVTCSRSVSVTSLGAGKAPRVESQVSGNCAKASGAAGSPAAVHAVAPAPDPDSPTPALRPRNHMAPPLPGVGGARFNEWFQQLGACRHRRGERSRVPMPLILI